MDNLFLNEFRPISSKEWKQKIQFNLDGADYIQSLIKNSLEGIATTPFYNYENVELIEVPEQKKELKSNLNIFISKEKTANFIALKAIDNGFESLTFEAKKVFDITTLLSNIPEYVEIQFNFHFLCEDFYLDVIKNTKTHRVFLNIDVIGNLAKTGNWYKDFFEDIDITKNIISNSSANHTPLLVDASIYQNSGANILQQVSYALAHLNEYLTLFNKSKTIQVKFAIGSNYYFEIAKIGAFKHLFHLIVDAHNLTVDLNIICEPTRRNKTIYKQQQNTLKTFTECTSAVISGIDTISNISATAIYKKKNNTDENIASKQLNEIKDNFNLEAVKSISKNNYIIETLTTEIAKKSLEIFKSIEQGGGFLEQLKNGTIQRKIKASRDLEQANFDENPSISIPTKIPNSEIEIYPFLKINKRKTIITPIFPIRLSEKIEKERLENEA